VLALEALVASDPDVGGSLFVRMLENPQRSVRLRALLGIERSGDPDSAFEVVKVMEHDPDLDLRVVAARALGSLGNPEAVPALRIKITSHHPVLREQSVLSLMKLGNENVGEYLIQELEDDRDLDVFNSLKLLALVPDPSLIARISHYLEAEDPLVRTHAAITILSILERSRTGAP
jgi:HEAT repeat protein